MFQFGKPIYADYILDPARGLPTFLSESHCTRVLGPDVLRNMIVSGCYILRKQ